MKALFFRKCKTKTDLQWHYDMLPSFGQELEYKIVKTKILNNNDYHKFANGFLMYFDFIDKIKDELYMDENDCVHCLLVKSENDPGILVYPSGYSYARYTALY